MYNNTIDSACVLSRENPLEITRFFIYLKNEEKLNNFHKHFMNQCAKIKGKNNNTKRNTKTSRKCFGGCEIDTCFD